MARPLVDVHWFNNADLLGGLAFAFGEALFKVGPQMLGALRFNHHLTFAFVRHKVHLMERGTIRLPALAFPQCDAGYSFTNRTLVACGGRWAT